MNITNARYVDSDQSGTNDGINVTVDDVLMHVPLVPGNRHYDEIMRQVAAGDLTIQDAD